MPKVNSNCSYYHLPEAFPLETGGHIIDPVIAYHSYGKLNEERNNVIFICHALTANSNAEDWWHGLFGKGDLFDWDKYFIICPNNLGSPYGSSSPKQIDPSTKEKYGMDFPFFTIRDTAKFHIELLKHLKINSLKLLIGGSGGGNISQELAYLWNDRVENLALLCCSAMETPWVIGIHESQRIVLRGDPSLVQKTPDAGTVGLKACRGTALPFYRTHASFKLRQHEHDLSKINDFRASSYINYQGDKFVKRFDAHCYYHLLNALDSHNMGRDRDGVEEALAQIKANTIVIGFDSDLLIPTIEQQFLAKHIPNATYVEIKTLFGHDGFLIETKDITARIRSIIQI